MIKPFRALSCGTLVANPRRKRRHGKRHGFGTLLHNPRKKRAGKQHSRKAKNPLHLFGKLHRKAKSHRRKSRNPGMEMGGINLIDLGIGSAGTIGLSSIAQALIDKYAPASVKTMPGATAFAPGLVAVGAYFGGKKATGKLKSILKYVALTAGFETVNQLIGTQIKSTVAGLLPSTGGYYTAAGQRVGGVYLQSPQTGGAWIQGKPATAGAFAKRGSMFGVG